MTTPDPQPPEPPGPPEPPAQPDPQPPEPAEPPEPDQPESDAELRAALERERARAKAAEGKLHRLQRDHMTDAEKALDAARAEGRADAARSQGKRVALAELRALLTGKVRNPADLAARVDLAGFVGDDGEVDSDELSKMAEQLVEAIAPAGNGAAARVPAGPQGTPASDDIFGAVLRGR